MADVVHAGLSRRERQLMDILFRLGEATAEEIRAELVDPPKNATVRRILRILEEKGVVEHRQEGKTFVYSAKPPKEKEGRSALRHLVDTFFEGSAPTAVAAMLKMSRGDLTDQELSELADMIRQFRDQTGSEEYDD